MIDIPCLCQYSIADDFAILFQPAFGVKAFGVLNAPQQILEATLDAASSSVQLLWKEVLRAVK